MTDVRTLAAAVLGVALGILFVAAPETVIQVQTAGRLPQDRRGRYGEDGMSDGQDDEANAGSGSGTPARWRRLVQVVGVALILGGGYFAWTLV
ncbi:hypothetical protein [Halobellus rufus]|uniref:hypothetical protein n=1 Tax=Halobellus rufus TaxID=1448860 RepID=UPI000679C533|nr:hypothetical protein [Halobellus rufus]